MYLGWYDPDKKKSSKEKLADAVERYKRKWGRKPTIALVNEADAHESKLVEVRTARHVAPNTFFVGDDEDEAEDALAA